MKKHGLIKILSLVVIVLVILSWIIPISQFTGTEMAKADITRVGFFDLINYPFLAIQLFIQMIIFILVIGGFYAILNKTGKYTELVEKIAKKLKGKEVAFLVIIAFLFAGFSSVFGFSVMLFIFIPFIVSIILLLGYDKIVAFLVTIVSVLVGVIGSTYNLYISGYVNQMLSLNYTDQIVAKIALFVLVFALYIMFTIKYANKVKKNSKESILPEKTEDEFLGEKPKSKSKKKAWPIVVVMSLLFAVFFMGTVPWNDVFGITTFTSFNEWLLTFEVGDHTIISYILGQIGELGTWYYGELTLMLVIASFILCLVYKIKVDDAIEAFGEGAKKLIKPAIVMALAMVVVVITAYHPFFTTIVDAIIGWMDTFNIITVFLLTIIGAIGSLLNVEMVYLSQSVLPYLGVLFADSTPIIAVLFQAIYGLTMFVAPTSLMLILGLEYLKIPYKTWLKFSWKLVLQILAIVLAVVIIITLI